MSLQSPCRPHAVAPLRGNLPVLKSCPSRDDCILEQYGACFMSAVDNVAPSLQCIVAPGDQVVCRAHR